MWKVTLPSRSSANGNLSLCLLLSHRSSIFDMHPSSWVLFLCLEAFVARKPLRRVAQSHVITKRRRCGTLIALVKKTVGYLQKTPQYVFEYLKRDFESASTKRKMQYCTHKHTPCRVSHAQFSVQYLFPFICFFLNWCCLSITFFPSHLFILIMLVPFMYAKLALESASFDPGRS